MIPTPALTAILPGDLGLGANFLALTFVAVGLGVVISLFVIYWTTKRPRLEDRWIEDRVWSSKEWIYTIVFLVVVMFFASSTLGLLPYPYAHSNLTPNATVNVRAQQFQWCISYAPNWGTGCQAAIAISAGSIVLFNTSSIDVNHGFGIYSASGQLLDQVQVMPGFYNTLIYQFTKPGIYYIRCMEFCGYGHFGMVSEINVTTT